METIQKNNMKEFFKNSKLIHEFMGKSFGLTDLLLPYNDWNYLMPVVEKIESIEFIDRVGRFNINAINFEENYTGIITDKGEVLIQEDGENKRIAIYNVVIEFIKWFNSQN